MGISRSNRRFTTLMIFGVNDHEARAIFQSVVCRKFREFARTPASDHIWIYRGDRKNLRNCTSGRKKQEHESGPNGYLGGGGVRVLLRSARRNAAEKRRAHDFSAIPTHAVALTKSTRSFRFNEQFICCLPALLFPPRVRGEHPQPTTTALGTSWRSIASLSKIFCHLSIGRFAGKFSVEKYQQPTWIQLIRQCSLRAYEFYKSLNYSFTIL